MSNFPFLQGIPPLSGGQNVAVAGAALLAAGVLSSALNSTLPKWGIYDSTGTTEQITPDNFLGIDYSAQRNVSNYPIENGAFASYDKVKQPFRISVKMSLGGSDNDRKAFLSKIDLLIDSLEMMVLVTPYGNYQNVTIERYDYRREIKNGVGLLIVIVHFVQVMTATITEVSGTIGTSPTNPSAIANQNIGSVAPTSLTQQAINTGLGAI